VGFQLGGFELQELGASAAPGSHVFAGRTCVQDVGL